MAKLLPDGTYNIINVQYAASLIELLHGRPYGTVSAHVENKAFPERQQWTVKNIGGTGVRNTIILESAAVPGYYASTSTYAVGTPISGSQSPTVWTVTKITGRDGIYKLTAASQFDWTLNEPNNHTTTTLERADGDPTLRAQWKFVKVQDPSLTH